jgi:hypothetical protein
MTEPSAPDGLGWYRNPARNWAVVAYFVGFGVFFPVSFRVLRAPGGYELAITVLSFLVAATAITTVPRAGIRVDAHGVTVRNGLGVSQQVSWPQVIRFELTQSSGKHGALTSLIQVICRDGEPVRSFGCSARARHLDDCPPKMAELAARLEAVRLRQTGQPEY